MYEMFKMNESVIINGVLEKFHWIYERFRVN